MQHCRVQDTDVLRKNSQTKILSLERPCALHCDFGNSLFSVPLELSGQVESRLRYTARLIYRTRWMALPLVADYGQVKKSQEPLQQYFHHAEHP